MEACLAAVFGALDWWGLPKNTRAKRIGLLHGGGNLQVVLLFIASWLLRRPLPEQPGTVAVGFSLAGVALALVSGWLGGELVDRMGVGVDQGAHLNAPSSLTGKPAARRTSEAGKRAA